MSVDRVSCRVLTFHFVTALKRHHCGGFKRRVWRPRDFGCFIRDDKSKLIKIISMYRSCQMLKELQIRRADCICTWRFLLELLRRSCQRGIFIEMISGLHWTISVMTALQDSSLLESSVTDRPVLDTSRCARRKFPKPCVPLKWKVESTEGPNDSMHSFYFFRYISWLIIYNCANLINSIDHLDLIVISKKTFFNIVYFLLYTYLRDERKSL